MIDDSHNEREAAQPRTPLTLHMAWLLAAPHTWPAAIIPTLIAAACASTITGTLSASLACALLAICVLMQSSVNTFNDYFDYVKGSDSKDDDVDPSDAVLVYNNVNPRAALALAVGFLVAAFALGIYVIYRAGLVPLGIGVVGAIIVVAYSGGKTPISYLPIGEAISGIVMGGLIPLACFYSLTCTLRAEIIAWALPCMIGIALIMFTNNTCDIEKDVVAHRRTLSVLLGRERARYAYHALLYTWIVAIMAIIAWWFTSGLIVMPFMLLAAYPFIKALLENPLASQTRIAAMTQICAVNVTLGAFYAAAIFASGGTSLIW